MSHHLAQGNQLARIRTEYLIRLFKAWFRSQVQQIRKASRIRRDHEYLMGLSDEMLADIGLTRFDIDKGYHRRMPPSHGMHLW